MRLGQIWWWLLPACVLGCASVQPAPDAPPAVAERPAEAADAPAPTHAAAPTDAAPRAPGTLARAEVDQVLAGSPGAFLAHVDSEPRFKKGRFAGWKLVSFFPGDARLEGVDLRPGDVVTRVNGSSLERPEQLLELWQTLKASKELVVEVERNGAPRTLRWTIAP